MKTTKINGIKKVKWKTEDKSSNQLPRV